MPLVRYLMVTVLLCSTTWAVAQVRQHVAVPNPYTTLSSPAANSGSPVASATPSYLKPAQAANAVASGTEVVPKGQVAAKANSAQGATKKASSNPAKTKAAKKTTASTSSKKATKSRKKVNTTLRDSLYMAQKGLPSDSTKQARNPRSVLAQYARRLNVSDTAFRVPSLYLIVDEWLGTPYRYGRSDKKGTDCSGLVGKIFSNFFPDVLPRSASGMSAVIDPKPIEELKEGDLVFFNYYGRHNSHVGLYLQNGWFIHASTVNGVTLNNLNTAYYRKRFSKGGPLKIGSFEALVQSGSGKKKPKA